MNSTLFIKICEKASTILMITAGAIFVAGGIVAGITDLTQKKIKNNGRIL